MTKENAHLYLPLVQALAEGETIEVSDRYDNWLECPRPLFHELPERYRIQMEKRPLDAGDVPPGSVFRDIDDAQTPYWSAPVNVHDAGVVLHNDSDCLEVFTWAELQENCQIKRPGEDWKPCLK